MPAVANGAPRRRDRALEDLREVVGVDGGEVVVFHEGGPGDKLYILYEGHVEMWKRASTGTSDVKVAQYYHTSERPWLYAAPLPCHPPCEAASECMQFVRRSGEMALWAAKTMPSSPARPRRQRAPSALGSASSPDCCCRRRTTRRGGGGEASYSKTRTQL